MGTSLYSLVMLVWIAAAFLLNAANAAVEDFSGGAVLFDLSAYFQRSPDASWGGAGDQLAGVCAWAYVKCSAAGQITQLDLSNLNLGGTLSSGIGDIKSLESLRLGGNGFVGTLPSTLGSLQNLTLLDVSNNNFTGTIPTTLGTLPSLTSLNVSSNKFEGPIPLALQQKFCNLSFLDIPATSSPSSNSFVECSSGGYVAPSPPPSKSSNLGLILGLAIGVSMGLVLLIGAIGICCWLRTKGGFKRLTTEEIQDIEAGLSGLDLSRVRRYSLQEIMAATDGFSLKRKLGEGGYAEVFKGKLRDGSEVAVKRIKDWRIGRGEMVTFFNEVDLIGRAVHRHVLRLEGFCVENGERILVFPYMANGSVADHLQGSRLEKRAPLPLALRSKAALGAAEGLAYLHTECDSCILHRDVKAANILLTENYTAVVGDFGLAKLLGGDETHVTTAVQGTFGHIAPEYILNGHVSEKTDVYGFGVFLLEIITGRDATYLAAQPREDRLLRDWVTEMFDRGLASQLVDVELLMMDMNMVDGQYDLEPIKDLVQVAMLCLAEDPKQRPSMADCIQLLKGQGLDPTWELWKKGVDDITIDQHDLLNAMDDFQTHSFLSVSDGSTGMSLVGRSIVGGPR